MEEKESDEIRRREKTKEMGKGTGKKEIKKGRGTGGRRHGGRGE